jgi:hypothetical protein
MEWIEDLEFGRVRTQGTLAVGVFIRTCTVSFLPVDWRSITPAGSPRAGHGFFLPVRVLSRMFRGKLLCFLKQSFRCG